MFQQMLGVCGASLVSPGWLVLSGMVGMCDVQSLEITYYNVIPDFSEPTHTPWMFDFTKHRNFQQSTVQHVFSNISRPCIHAIMLLACICALVTRATLITIMMTLQLSQLPVNPCYETEMFACCSSWLAPHYCCL